MRTNLFMLLGYFSHSIPRKHAGNLVPCALWCATQAQQCACRGHPSFVQGQSMLLYGQGMVVIPFLHDFACKGTKKF